MWCTWDNIWLQNEKNRLEKIIYDASSGVYSSIIKYNTLVFKFVWLFLMRLKFSSNLSCLFVESNLNEIFIKFKYYWK